MKVILEMYRAHYISQMIRKLNNFKNFASNKTKGLKRIARNVPIEVLQKSDSKYNMPTSDWLSHF
jgi:hypothetical protein